MVGPTQWKSSLEIIQHVSFKVAALTLTFLTLACQGTNAQDTLVAEGAEWRYLDDGTDQQTAWIVPGFSDAAWKTGVAPLGYGDDDETTEVLFGPGPDNASNDPDNRFITTYFRHTFSVADPPDYTNALLRVLHDDGVVVYLNGTEVFRSGVPEGAIDHLTNATFSVADDDETINFYAQEIDPALLVASQNVLAVEIHQVDATSSDISMDLELIANFERVPPSVSITSPTDGETMTPDTIDTILIAADATDPDGTVELVEFFHGDVKVAEDATAPYSAAWVRAEEGRYTVTAVATDSSGLRGTASVDIAVVAPPPVLIARGDDWRYDDTGTDLGDAWRETSFDDSNWPSAPAELGYGDGDEETVIGFGPDADNKHPTYYFRKIFDVALTCLPFFGPADA